ncbi:MAG: hypothetical protein LBQ22_04330 [Bacteroidales bacterium]|jgi:signal transduction histidine kinase|nr:hypothetical protein [Bacteroidales bacterium]
MKIKNYHIIILSIVLSISVLFTYLFGFDSLNINEKYINANNIESILNQKQYDLIITTEEIREILDDTDKIEKFFYEGSKDLFEKNGTGFLLYENNILKYWTTNGIPVPTSSTFHFFDKHIINLNNGWYLSYPVQENEYLIVGLFQIKKEYTYENDNLSTYFWHEFNLPSNITISTDHEQNSLEICINDGENCIYLLKTDSYTELSGKMFTLKHFLLLFNLLIIIIIISLLFIKFYYKYKNYNWLLFLFLAGIFIILRYCMLRFNYFDIFTGIQLFSPELFAESFWLPSLGDYFVNVILFIVFSILFFRYFNLNIKPSDNKIIKIIISISASIILLFTTGFISELFYGLVWNSSISFEFDKILNLTIYSIIATLIIVIVILCFLLIFYKLFNGIKNHFSLPVFSISFITIILLILLFYDLKGTNPYSFLIFSGLFSSLWILLAYTAVKQNMNYGISIVFLIIISLITSEYFSRLSNQKELDAYKVITYNLAAERDASAEFFIKQAYYEIQNDENISRYIFKKDFNSLKNRINNIISSKRYFNKYETQITICSCSDSLLVEPDMISVDCFDFFRQQVDMFGIVIPNTNFYFLDNHNGRISYLGEISTLLEDSTYINIYIELNSKIFSEGLGYPELLLDKKLVVKKGTKDYNYAKYVNDKLISSKGDYKYQFTLKPEERDTSEYLYYIKDGYIHFRYRPDENNLIILSKPNTQYSNELVSFTYVFAILFILFNLLWLIINIINGKIKAGTSLKTKTQISYVTILILSLIVTGSISIYFIIQAYKQKQREILQDKVFSVLVELEQTVGDEPGLTYEHSKYLNTLLVDFSNVFYTDINIFDLNGLLLSSSRIELYDKGLKGRYMDSRAYKELILNNSGAIIINENIDKINYLSAYVPFRNYNNDVIAYLNLPYFARQNEYTAEISNFIIAFSNIFLLLILISVIVGIFISRQLTRPLVLIRDKIKAMDIKEKTEKIIYNKNDEIGGLIREYNRKVDELSESVNKLAQSERELAWREMAKQIAHEIKNPLTPMKLSVQHLERAYDMKDKNWETTYKKVSKTLIEQIDTLSRIASEFSNFAQMPDSKKNIIDLKEVIMNSVQLFATAENVKFVINFKVSHPITVIADKEQMLRVFNNLIKNSIQAIPKNKEGIITIEAEEMDNNYIIKVIDNGSGIPENMIPKIFQPNFTTKSAGMGLGLSMVKNMLLSNNASIYFKTAKDKGTEFIIEIPKAQ